MVQSPFTATKLQVASYLLGVALFSISFLVFLNASVSFVVTDLIGQKERVGDAVGTLGFADELVVLVACPIWGLLSDKLGVRTVVVIGYGVVGLSLFVFVQARNVYPQLLLGRLLFSVGGAATSTMVTAILPTMTMPRRSSGNSRDASHIPSISSEAGPTPAGFVPPSATESRSASGRSTSQIAGWVGMFTGLGALIALGAFLPLPARLQHDGYTPAEAITDSFYFVGSIAFAVALACAFGLAGLAGEEDKGLLNVIRRMRYAKIDENAVEQRAPPVASLLLGAMILGFTDVDIALGYLGGFVARASSVGISLFIPLYVNAYFVSSGLCKDNPNSDPTEIKQNCRDAYVIAAILSGVSQLVALLCAPLFGYLDSRFSRRNVPLLVASAAGVVGYVVFARIQSPEPRGERGNPAVFLVMALLGISQIGAIVCSLSSLSRGIHGGKSEGMDTIAQGTAATETSTTREDSPLLPSPSQRSDTLSHSRDYLKGSIAGIYSLAGGAGILLLTKLGGALFDSLSSAAPFYMLAIFNGSLLLATAGLSFLRPPLARG